MDLELALRGELGLGQGQIVPGLGLGIGLIILSTGSRNEGNIPWTCSTLGSAVFIIDCKIYG